MRARIRFIAPLVAAVALTAACGESGSSGTGGGSESSGNASGDACAPVAGDKLVVLEDDKHLQNADNVIPAVNAAFSQGQPALLPALNAVSAKLTTEDLVDMNAAVDVERKSAEDVAAALGRGERRHRRPREGQRPGRRRRGRLHRVHGPGQRLRRRAQGRRVRRHRPRGRQPRAVPEGARGRHRDPGLPRVPGHRHRVPRRRRGAGRSPAATSTRRSPRCSRWPRRPGWPSASRRRPSTRTRSPSPPRSPRSWA